MADDEELRSVRIEVEGEAPATPDAPAIEGDGVASRGLPKWIVAMAILVVGVVGAIVLSLRPADDTAADGTERQAPTTTIAGEEGATEGDPAEPIEDLIDPGETAIAEATVVPTPLLFDGRVSEIIAGDFGFFALRESRGNDSLGSPSPSLLRSVDGEDWFEVGTSVSSDDGSQEQDRAWFNLATFGDGLVLTGQNFEAGGNFPETEVFVSEAGAEWTKFAPFSPSPNEETFPRFPVVFSDEAVFSLEFNPFSVLSVFVGAHTDFDIPPLGVCAAEPTNSEVDDSLSFEVFDCSFNPIGIIDETAISSPFPNEEVLDCLNTLSLEFFVFDLMLIRQDPITGGSRTVLGRISPSDLPVMLSTGGIAFVDEGIRELGPLDGCEGLVDTPELIEPSLRVATTTSDEYQTWPLPPGTDAGGVGARLVGELTIGGSSHLVVVATDGLWTLDTQTAEWTRAPAEFEPSGFQLSATVSESGTRVYAITDSAVLLALDGVVGADGTLEFLETSVPISSDGVPASSLGFAGILYADDDVLFLADGIEAWSLEAPPLPN